MDEQTGAAIRARLEAEFERLAAEIAEIDREDRDTLSEASGENNYRDHMADQGSATFERELDMTLEENTRQQLAEVSRALQLMDADKYGVCERCDAEIPTERLEAVPTTLLCIACKEAEEAR